MIGEPVSNSIEAFLDKAEVHLDKGETEEAEKIFRSLLVVFPEDKRALGGMQKIQRVEAANLSPKLTPTQDKMHEIIGLYNQGRFQEVLENAEETVRKSAPNIILFNLIAAANSGLKNWDQAIENFNKVIEINPKDAMAYFNIGTIFSEKEEFDIAIKNYQKCLAINPDHAEAHDNMGSALKAQGNLTAAVEQFTQAINLKPNFAQAHYNLGVALQEQENFSESIKSYEKACQIKPNYFKAYLGIGNILKEQGKVGAAIDSYKQAIKIKPDYAEAYSNMGIALNDKGELDVAIDSYKQAIKIKPDYADAYVNMGNALGEKGEFDAAIDIYKQALKITPNHSMLWNNIVMPLQATKLQSTHLQDCLSLLAEQKTSNHVQIAKSILQYRLDLGSVSASNSLDKAISMLATGGNISIENPYFKNSELQKKPKVTKKVTALVHFGRSGTGLLHSLIDGHPEVSTLPSIYLSEFFDHSNWAKINEGGWSEMVANFMAIYEVLFDASSPNPIATISRGVIKALGRKEGMANLGEKRNEILSVDKKVFSGELTRLMDYHDRLDALTFFKLVHFAFDKTLNDGNKKNLIFYHIHNPDTYAQLNFLKSAPDANWLIMVREPVQSCEAWVRDSFRKNEYAGVVNKIFKMLFEIDNVIFQNENAIGLRLEDLKEYPKKTIPALCAWLGIKEEKSLYEMTAQGKKWWGDPVSPDYDKDGMNPFGKTSINRKLGSVFSENDQFVLRTLFYPFSVRFGYAAENLEQFKNDLQAVRPMLNQMFDFEKKIVLETKAHTEQFVKSGSYLYLRSGMIERWNTLNKFHTYPNMIRPLKIN